MEKQTPKRKGLYHDWITEEGLNRIESWARDGLIDVQIAQNIGVTERTLNNWKIRFPSVDSALKRGKAPIDFQVENAMLKSALGYEYEEEIVVQEKAADGSIKTKIQKVKKHQPANVTAQIFWSKNRKPDQWRDKRDIEHSGGLNNTNKVSEMTEEELDLEIAKLEADLP